MAGALQEYWTGLLFLHRGDAVAAEESFARAVALVPEKVSSAYEELATAVEICADAQGRLPRLQESVRLANAKLEGLKRPGLVPRLEKLVLVGSTLPELLA
jgi:hypothetical protein